LDWLGDAFETRENLILDFRETGTPGSDVPGGKGFGFARMIQNWFPTARLAAAQAAIPV